MPTNELVQFYAAPKGSQTYNIKAAKLLSLTVDRYPYGGTGYIAGINPGILTVDGAPASRPVELRLRENNRNLVAKTYSNPIDGTYLFKDLSPYLQFDIIARDEPNYVYNDVIIGGVWPWTDYELILHGTPAPFSLATSFSRTYEITGGTPPYSISGSSVIPTGVTATLDERILSISSTGDPGTSLNLIINDSSALTKTIAVMSPTAYPGMTARAFRIFITQRTDGAGGGTTAAGYMNIAMNLCGVAGGPNLCNATGTSNPVAGSSGGQSTTYSGYDAISGFKYARGAGGLWHSDLQEGPWWAYFDFGTPTNVQQVVIIPENTGASSRTPYNFVIQSSDDLITWNDILSVNAQTGWALGTEKTFVIAP